MERTLIDIESRASTFVDSNIFTFPTALQNSTLAT